MRHPYLLKQITGIAAALVCIALCVGPVHAGEIYPGKTWKVAAQPEDYGYSSQQLHRAQQYADHIHTAAVVIIVDGVIVYEWGEVHEKFMSHSMRKSFLSALYGNYVRQGIINLDKSILALGVNDNPSLSLTEKQATIRDLLKSRSGIYHPALYETSDMKVLKPDRHSHTPGTHWYYNNWDFNVLGTIFEEETGVSIFEAIKTDIAEPIGMEDYVPDDGWYVTGKASRHAAYPFRITARDLSRFGYLMLRKGRWNDQQVIPEDWVIESTAYHSDAALYDADGYGYMWWVARNHNKYPHLPGVTLPEGSYSARGAGGHYLLIIPAYDMVIVHRVNTDMAGHNVTPSQFGRLTQLILDARIR